MDKRSDNISTYEDAEKENIGRATDAMEQRVGGRASAGGEAKMWDLGAGTESNEVRSLAGGDPEAVAELIRKLGLSRDTLDVILPSRSSRVASTPNDAR